MGMAVEGISAEDQPGDLVGSERHVGQPHRGPGPFGCGSLANLDAEIQRLRTLALEREVEERRVAQARLEAQASLDALTGLFNRTHLEVLAEETRLTLASDRPVSLLMLDIDHFKSINDRYGHTAGDHVLAGAAEMLRENARASDVPCRYGGDGLTVILCGHGPTEIAAQLFKQEGASFDWTKFTLLGRIPASSTAFVVDRRLGWTRPADLRGKLLKDGMYLTSFAETGATGAKDCHPNHILTGALELSTRRR